MFIGGLHVCLCVVEISYQAFDCDHVTNDAQHSHRKARYPPAITIIQSLIF